MASELQGPINHTEWRNKSLKSAASFLVRKAPNRHAAHVVSSFVCLQNGRSVEEFGMSLRIELRSVVVLACWVSRFHFAVFDSETKRHRS